MTRQTKNRPFGRRALLLGGGVVLGTTSCSGVFTGGDTETTEGASTLRVQVTNVPHLDPQSIGYGMWLDQMGLLEGLVLQKLDGTDVRPAAAETWDVSEDGTTYTFNLRKELSWSTGEPLLAEHFVWTYERLLDPSRGAGGVTTGANSYQTNLGILNAEQFMSGEIEDFSEVGVKAVDESTLKITLEIANPGFLMGLAHPSMLPLNPDAEETWQDPETWVGNGPFNVAAWTLNSAMTLKKNPEYWDADNVGLDSVEVQLIEQGALTSTVPYEDGELDILAIDNAGDVTRFMEDPTLKEQVYTVEDVTTAYLARMHSRNALLEDPKIRSALSLGLGREEIAGISPTAKAATTLVNPTLPGWSKDVQAHEHMYGDEAVAEGKKLLAEAGYPDGDGFPTITLLAGSDFPQIDVVVDTWSTNLNISVTKDIVEAGVYVEKRAELHDDDYLGMYWGSFSGDATWPYHVEQLWDPMRMEEHGLPADAYSEYLKLQESGDVEGARKILETESEEYARTYAELVPTVRETTDEDEQQARYVEAATVREKSEVFIPVTWNSAVLAAKPHVEGFSPRAQADRYYFRDLSISEKE